jgi:hypothetical protein
MPVIPATWEAEKGTDCGSRLAQANSSQDLISKITRGTWTGDVAQVVGHPFCKCETLGPHTKKKRKEKKKGKKKNSEKREKKGSR